jgi:hypothetical protein
MQTPNVEADVTADKSERVLRFVEAASEPDAVALALTELALGYSSLMTYKL